MLVIGLTGGIGAGKTTVSELFAQQGVPIIDADVIARNLTKPNEPAFLDILDHFEDAVLLENGTLDRAKIREIIFANPHERLWLESYLHPLIRQEIAATIAKLKAPYCIIVIPLLVEVEPYPFIDRILVVDAIPELQVERVKTRDNVSAAEVLAIINTQIDREKRLTIAHDVIHNEGDLKALAYEVEKLHHFYTELSHNKNTPQLK